MCSTGAQEPKPSRPSRTIVPEATASSTRCEPHWFAVPPRSTPWSSDHQVRGATWESGYRGNTHPLAPIGYGLVANTAAGAEGPATGAAPPGAEGVELCAGGAPDPG